MRKTISTFLALIFLTLLTGCGSSNDKISSNDASSNYVTSNDASSNDEEVNLNNLDYENAEIIENTPTTGKWKKLTFEISGLDDRSADRLARIASNFDVTVEKKELMLGLMEIKEDGTEFVPLTEEAEAILSEYLNYKLNKPEEFPYSHMFYFSDDSIYIEVQAGTGGMIEYDNRKNINSVLGLDYHFVGPWRPGFFNTDVVSVETNDESTTCVLDGKTVKVADAIKYAEKYVLENDTLFPKEFGARVRDVDILSYKNTDNQSLSLLFEYTIDGVVLDGAPSYAIYDENGKRYKTFPTSVEIAMVTENTIDWLWFDGETDPKIEDCELTISREKACEIVSQKLSQEYKFNVKEIRLMYVGERVGDGKYSVIEPVWRFYITDIKAQEYSRLYVYVSAIDGEVQMAEVMN